MASMNTLGSPNTTSGVHDAGKPNLRVGLRFCPKPEELIPFLKQVADTDNPKLLPSYIRLIENLYELNPRDPQLQVFMTQGRSLAPEMTPEMGVGMFSRDCPELEGHVGVGFHIHQTGTAGGGLPEDERRSRVKNGEVLCKRAFLRYKDGGPRRSPLRMTEYTLLDNDEGDTKYKWALCVIKNKEKAEKDDADLGKDNNIAEPDGIPPVPYVTSHDALTVALPSNDSSGDSVLNHGNSAPYDVSTYPTGICNCQLIHQTNVHVSFPEASAFVSTKEDNQIHLSHSEPEDQWIESLLASLEIYSIL